MKIGLSEIWNFSEMIDAGEKGWSFELEAGDVRVENISQDLLVSLKNDEAYDTELLPSIFTFREILWQPDVFTESVQSLPGLRILKAYCDDVVTEYQESESPSKELYAALLQGLASASEQAIAELDQDASVKRALGNFRTAAFPIIKFFINHPQNRGDYYRDAVNRLNYAVKIMLTQFHGKYTELSDPYWNVTYNKPKQSEMSATKPIAEKEKS